ncbi:MAG TPA: maleylpyruvate isomerase family mycothiol-dependent enzyme [Acidimicrobiales bacterium]|nr:maleylpyruvate isomerase family mycothiol-dependent enzyme [Acidimicrobiales bacterium]
MASRRQRWELVAAERIALADRAVTLDPGQWDAPSRCEGWRVRDVLAHLVHMAESTWRSMSGDLRAQAGRDRDRGFLLCARELGKQPVPELADRLRRAAASHYSGMPKVALSEIAVHQDDMLRPLGLSPRLDPATVVAALDVLRRVDRWMPKLAFHGPSHRHVRLVATDTDWSSGRGPEVQGRALDLLALLGNRRGAGEGLSGPGVERLPVPGAATP